MRLPKIYVAGPMLGSGDPYENVHIAVRAADLLRKAGAAVFVPHLNAVWQMIAPAEGWLEHDLEWLAVCDAVYRIPGDSPGGDTEVEAARTIGIPVFGSLDEAVSWVRNRRGMGPLGKGGEP